MCTSLKVTPHPRGHIASCNGRVEKIEAWVEPVDIASCSTCASHRASQVQSLVQHERERKLAELARFRKDVKKRVRQVEKAKERKLLTEATGDSPRKVTFNHTPSHVTPTQNPENEAVQVEVEKAMHEGTSQTQRARRALLALCTGNAAEKTADVNGTTDGGAEKQRSEDNQGHQRNTLTYHQSTEEPRLAGDSLLQGLCRSSQGANQPIAVRDPSGGPMSSIPVHSQDNAYAEPTKPPSFPPGEQGGSHGRCVIVAPGRLEHDRMVQAQKQHLVFRRLWSQLEREQVRQARYQRKENQCATRLKGQREAERKMQERECCLAESNLAEQELMEDREKAEQWAVLLALEERKHRLTKAKENERFIEALREKVKQRMIQKHSQLPALCACARTFWETDPDTCANNCIFYKNEKAYAKALWSLMVSLELQ